MPHLNSLLLLRVKNIGKILCSCKKLFKKLNTKYTNTHMFFVLHFLMLLNVGHATEFFSTVTTSPILDKLRVVYSTIRQ